MYATPPPSFSASSSPPAASHVPPRPPERTLDGADLEEPPPYTPSPSAFRGETTVEQGPSRPFQPAPPPPSQNQQRWPNVQHQVTSNPTGTSSFSASSANRSAGSLLHQLTSTLTNSVNAAINNLNSPPLQSQQSWSSYPGRQPQQQQQQQQQPPPQSYRPPPGSPTLSPPPRHPSSTLSRHSSEFARDFYAAGAIDEPTNAVYAPPPGSPPPPLPRRPTNATSAPTSSAASSTPNDGRPTTHPSIGHPLLKDGKLLVYPKGYECPKCHNVGYKDADPLRPCKKCWSKYAKPFSGPLVYSFSPPSPTSPGSPTSTTAQNFQRPLPHPPPPQPPPIPPAVSLSAPPAHFAQGGYMTNHHGGFYTPPTGVHPSQTRLGRGIGRPPPGSVVYSAGDPRIGGMLCWRCDGKGNTSFMLLDRITCPVCGGVGRTF